MGFSERLRELRKGNGYSQNELAKRVHVTVNAIANYESGQNYPKFPVLIDLMEALKCDANYLFQDYISMAETREISEEERLIINKYRKLNAHGKKAVQAILAAEYECAEEWLGSGNLKDVDMYVPVLKSRGYVLAPTPKHIKIVPTGINDRAHYCVQIVSNTAKPMFRQGDVILLRREAVPHNGIGLFRVNGFIHIKKLYHLHGETRLMPFNVSTEPVPILESDKFETLGRVIGKLERNYIE